MEYIANYMVLWSVPRKAIRISASVIFFFLQLLLLPGKCRGFVVMPSFSLPDFLQLRGVDANKSLWKKRFTSDNKGRIILTLTS